MPYYLVCLKTGQAVMSIAIDVNLTLMRDQSLTQTGMVRLSVKFRYMGVKANLHKLPTYS